MTKFLLDDDDSLEWAIADKAVRVWLDHHEAGYISVDISGDGDGEVYAKVDDNFADRFYSLFADYIVDEFIQ